MAVCARLCGVGPARGCRRRGSAREQRRGAADSEPDTDTDPEEAGGGCVTEDEEAVERIEGGRPLPPSVEAGPAGRAPLSLLELPPELLVQIFGSLPGTDLPSLARVCTTFRRILSTDTIWRRRCREEYGVCENLRKLEITGVSCRDVYAKLLHRYRHILGLWQPDIGPYGGLLNVVVSECLIPGLLATGSCFFTLPTPGTYTDMDTRGTGIHMDMDTCGTGICMDMDTCGTGIHMDMDTCGTGICMDTEMNTHGTGICMDMDTCGTGIHMDMDTNMETRGIRIHMNTRGTGIHTDRTMCEPGVHMDTHTCGTGIHMDTREIRIKQTLTFMGPGSLWTWTLLGSGPTRTLLGSGPTQTREMWHPEALGAGHLLKSGSLEVPAGLGTPGTSPRWDTRAPVALGPSFPAPPPIPSVFSSPPGSFYGTGLIAGHGFTSPERTPGVFVLFDDDRFGFIWLELKSFSLYSRIKVSFQNAQAPSREAFDEMLKNIQSLAT
ncbi:FB31B protein, partial [Acrocephalus arundinaceus]|nr:FB31B protein [Acrocephalus arundinaceus]